MNDSFILSRKEMTGTLKELSHHDGDVRYSAQIDIELHDKDQRKQIEILRIALSNLVDHLHDCTDVYATSDEHPLHKARLALASCDTDKPSPPKPIRHTRVSASTAGTGSVSSKPAPPASHE